MNIYRQLYEFYLSGIQPKNINKILDFVDKYSITHKKRVFKSSNGDMIVNIKFERVVNNISEMDCYVDSCIAKEWK